MKAENTQLPVGPRVQADAAARPAGKRLTGKYVELRAIAPAADAGPLFEISHGSPLQEQIWTYLSYGPFPSASRMQAWLQERAASQNPLFYCVVLQSSGKPVGMCSYMRIYPEWQRLELGHIWYSLQAQRTRVNTETIYLLLKEAFENLGYRRIEWKCDSLNTRSRQAALRLGFKFEGIFQQHMIYKSRSRDTAWYAMLAGQWPLIKARLEHWLYENETGSRLERE